jgi:ubiquinone/menaquinone biosynthesis C-methylase UbiE
MFKKWKDCIAENIDDNLCYIFGYDKTAEREFVLKKAGSLEGKILEIGTGRGNFTLLLAKSGYSFTSVDISPEMQKSALRKLSSVRSEQAVRFCIENAERMSFPGGDFDTIISINTIHHIADPYKAVDEIIRLLSPSGNLIISDFSKKGLEIVNKAHRAKGKKHEEGTVRMEDIEKYLNGKKFKVEKHDSGIQTVIIGRRAI